MKSDPTRTTTALPGQASLPQPVRERGGDVARVWPTADPGEFSRFSVQGASPALSLDQTEPNWGLPESADIPLEVGVIEPMGDRHHSRLFLSNEYASGYVEFCGLAAGFLVHFNDVSHDRAQPVTISAPDILRVRVASDGDGEYVSAQGDRVDFKGAGCTIVIEPAGMPPASAVFVGRNRTVTVYIHRATLQNLYAEREHELPVALQAFISGSLGRTVAQRLPLNASLLRCVEDLLGCDLEGHSRRLFIGSKATEILCHAVKGLAQGDNCRGVDASAQMKRGVIKAQQQLMENFVDPPSLDDLARDVGLSRSSLCAGFRQIVGQTVFDYIGDLRMRRALSMLNERKASITQIAYAVGYSHPSSFSLAVQRRFGTPPSELRRRGASGDPASLDGLHP